MPPTRRSTRTTSTTAAKESTQPYTRANRQRSPGSTRPSASIARPANGKQTSLRLTVKAPPSKLRQATSGSDVSIPPNPYAADNASDSDATPQPSTRIARATRNPRVVVEPESDEEEDEDEEMQDGGDQDEDGLSGESGDEEDEDASGSEDELQANHPPPPVIQQIRPPGTVKPNVTVTAPPEGPVKSVEAKEMDEEDEDDDEELSELDSNEDELQDEEEDEEEGGEGASDDDENDMSRSATPDLSKLTRRQRGHFEEPDANLLALSNEAQKKKHLTAEEHAMRRAEMARRRKNLSEKRNEEEKVLTPLTYIACILHDIDILT